MDKEEKLLKKYSDELHELYEKTQKIVDKITGYAWDDTVELLQKAAYDIDEAAIQVDNYISTEYDVEWGQDPNDED